MIKNLVFDFGGVVVDIYWKDAVKEFARIGLGNAGVVLDRYKQNGIFLELEEGKIDQDTFLTRLSELCGGKPVTRDEAEGAWLGFFRTVSEKRMKMLEELHRKYKMFLLSNTNPFVMGWARSTRFTPWGRPLDYYFDKLYLSYKLGVTKPSPEIFQRMIDDAPLLPEETLFVDDGASNIEAARKLGFATLLVEEGEDWTEKIGAALKSND